MVRPSPNRGRARSCRGRRGRLCGGLADGRPCHEGVLPLGYQGRGGDPAFVAGLAARVSARAARWSGCGRIFCDLEAGRRWSIARACRARPRSAPASSRLRATDVDSALKSRGRCARLRCARRRWCSKVWGRGAPARSRCEPQADAHRRKASRRHRAAASDRRRARNLPPAETRWIVRAGATPRRCRKEMSGGAPAL